METDQPQGEVVPDQEEFMAVEMVPDVGVRYLPEVEQGDESEINNIPATAIVFYKTPEPSQETLQSNNPSAEGEKKSGASDSEDSTKVVIKHQRHASACKCNSCSSLQEITDCGICCNPLQGRSVSTCTHCNNVMCTDCTKGLVDCAFCRKEKSVVENLGLKRFLFYLTLPCRNACFGCPEWLTGRTRNNHEVCCTYKGITCSVEEKECPWAGTSGQVLTHLKEAHDITPLSFQRIAFQVADLQYQCSSNLGESTIHLHIDDQLVTIKITYFSRKLTLSITRLGYVRTVDESAGNNRYGVWLKIKKACVEDPEEKTAFATLQSEPRIIEIPTNIFLGADESLAEPIDVYLVVEVTVKKIRQC